MGKDYYKILGIEKTATEDEIKKAFRKQAHEYHPDKKTGNESKFKEANEAYQTLSDKKKRAEYDRFGQSGMGGNGGYSTGFGGFDSSQFEGFDFGNVGDIFSDFFGGGFSGGQSQRKGNDIQIQITISLRDAIFGVERSVFLTKTNKCNTCAGGGGNPGSKQNSCKKCNGQGRVQEQRRSVFGNVNTVLECDICHGSGKTFDNKCTDCKGKGVRDSQTEIKIKVPSGIDHGQSLRMSGQGEAIAHGSPGDLYVLISIEKDKKFVRKGLDLYTDVSVKLTDALLGTRVNLESFDGTESLSIPSGSNNGDILKIIKKGVKKNETIRGDIIVTLKVDMPKKISSKVSKLIEELQKEGI